MTTTLESIRLISSSAAQYTTRLALDAGDLRAAQALRFQVFNLELAEGFERSYATGLDEDPFDAVCDHLLVSHSATGEVVGTYRLQTGRSAAVNLGYYCSQEFEFDLYEPLRNEIIELGRACVHRQHRNLVVLGLLWRGIANYARLNGGRYLFGCSSLTSQKPTDGARAYADLCQNHLVGRPWRTNPRPEFSCGTEMSGTESVDLPKLLRAYLTLGGKICGPPAMDRQFKTIDFLTMLDLDTLPAPARQRFLT